MRRFVFALLLVPSLTYALTGDLLETTELPPQLCRVQFVSGEFCGGTIVGKRQVVLADHCGLMVDHRGTSRVLGRIACLGERGSRTFSKFETPNRDGKPFPRVSDASPIENSGWDVTLVVADEDFTTPPVTISSPQMARQVLNALTEPDRCSIFGVGLNPLGGLGVAHGVHAPVYRGAYSISNPIELVGESGVTPFDSGGPLICKIGGENVLVGVVSRGNGLVASPKSEATKNQKAQSVFAYIGEPEIYGWLESRLNGTNLGFKN